MPSSTTPTERQKRLGYEIRKLRTTSGMSAEYAAGLLGVDRGKISNMESGLRRISEERLRTLACNCDCTDSAYLDALIEMSRESRNGWWERYRGSLPQPLLDIAELEASASVLRAANAVHVPGLLQTADYALAVFRVSVPTLPEPEVGLRLAYRTERQQVIEEAAPPQYVAVVHEAALRMLFGGRDVMRAQLQHLLDMAERANVTVRVIPFAAGGFPGSGQTVHYIGGPVPQLDTVQIDSSHGPEFLWAEGQLKKYRAQLEWWESLALPPALSRDLVQDIIRGL